MSSYMMEMQYQSNVVISAMVRENPELRWSGANSIRDLTVDDVAIRLVVNDSDIDITALIKKTDREMYLLMVSVFEKWLEKNL